MDEQWNDEQSLIQDGKEICHRMINRNREAGKALLGVMMFGHRDLQIELAKWLQKPVAQAALDLAGHKVEIDQELYRLRMAGVK